jgi:hypothetical protein
MPPRILLAMLCAIQWTKRDKRSSREQSTQAIVQISRVERVVDSLALAQVAHLYGERRSLSIIANESSRLSGLAAPAFAGTTSKSALKWHIANHAITEGIILQSVLSQLSYISNNLHCCDS